VIALSVGQLEAWLTATFLPFVRIGACLMVAPIFGARFVPPRTRIALAGAITLIIVPMLPVPSITPVSAAAVVVLFQQLMIGLACGFALQLVFDALALGGQILANSMGLSFALNIDPQRGSSTPAVGQFYVLLATLTFLALGGHLLLIQVIVESFRSMPIGTIGIGNAGLWMLIAWGGQIFVGAVAVSLPGVTALLIVNLAFGVMSRAAPTLNLFAVGFPLSLIVGLVVILTSLPAMQATFINLVEQAFVFLRSLTQARG
jgi:flagellar biosynthetic protein FliR